MVIINGAGIAGLTLANALNQKQIPFLIIEQAPQLESIGAGIALQNNGLAILERLGLMADLPLSSVTEMGLGQVPTIRRIALTQVELSCRVVHRAQLQSALLAKLPANYIRFNSCIEQCDIRSNSVQVRLNDQTNLTADYVVNAAGIHSALHAPAKLRDTNHLCWRTVVKLNRSLSCFGEYWFGQHRLGIAPIDAQRAYVFHVIKTKARQNAEHFNRDAREGWIRDQAEFIPDITALQLDGCEWLLHPLRDRTLNWGVGRVVAIGDAAHAMTPNLGQGAVLAMEDAIEVAQLIQHQEPDLANALTRVRHRRVARMHRLSYWVGVIAHLENPLINPLKAALFKWMPMHHGLRKQVKWMNQFNQRLMEYSK